MPNNNNTYTTTSNGVAVTTGDKVRYNGAIYTLVAFAGNVPGSSRWRGKDQRGYENGFNVSEASFVSYGRENGQKVKLANGLVLTEGLVFAADTQNVAIPENLRNIFAEMEKVLQGPNGRAFWNLLSGIVRGPDDRRDKTVTKALRKLAFPNVAKTKPTLGVYFAKTVEDAKAAILAFEPPAEVKGVKGGDIGDHYAEHLRDAIKWLTGNNG